MSLNLSNRHKNTYLFPFFKKPIELLLFLAVLMPAFLFAQVGKEGASVISSDATINSFSKVVADAAIGDTLVQVMNVRQLDNIEFGDLVLIIQMQGASISTSTDRSWGEVTNLNNAGNYEFVYVRGVDSANNYIRFCTPLTNNYTESGNVQVVQVPQYTDLTLNGGTSIGTPSWNGIVGGVIAIHASGTVTINGTVDASGQGFRGGVRDNETLTSGATVLNDYVNSNKGNGAEKGEGIAGFYAEYAAAGGRYCRGAPANGGGGGNSHNAGGGGGANAGILANWNGYGVMNTSSTGFTAYQLDPGYIHHGGYTTSSGGGRGGYSFAFANLDALSVGPGISTWTGDYRDSVGGLGGRPIDGYAVDDRVFMGGGGGAGDGNNSASYNGSEGGGIVIIIGNIITGSGTIDVSGDDALQTLAGGNDAPGGAGGGGSILLDGTTNISNLTLTAVGGTGGNQNIGSNESEGPGGGGGGGVIAATSPSTTSLTTSVIGGQAGTTNSASLTEFPKNGATDGNSGLDNLSVSITLPTYGCTILDRDRDGIADEIDIDTDNDGIPNSVERLCTQTTYTGNISAVTSETGITNSANILGASDASYASFDADTDALTIQLSTEIPFGTLLNVVWRKVNANGPGAEMRVSISADNVTYEEHDARYFRTSSTTAETISFPVTAATEYISITQSYNPADYDFEIDAIFFSQQIPSCSEPDNDGDGIPDYLDLDSDNDGIPDIIEAGGVDSDGDGRVDNNTDTDGDGLADIYDNDDTDGPDVAACDIRVDCDLTSSTSSLFDPNNDGTNELDRDTDGDGLADYIDLDADNDGIPDLIEIGGIDANGDGRVDVDMTNVANDADRDGFADTYDPDDDTSSGIDAGEAMSPLALAVDTDADGIYDELTDGNSISLDMDGDGLMNSIDLDADGDGILDIIEAGGTDSNGDGVGDNATDADGDGYYDLYDPNAADGPSGTGTNGTPHITASADGGDADTRLEYSSSGGIADTDGDDVPDYLDVDADNGGIFDIYEAQTTSSYIPPSGNDDDGDGIDNAFDDDDINWGGAGSAGIDPTNTDLADNPDYRDTDTDNDGVPDIQEAWDSLADGDSQPDGVSGSCTTDADGDGLVDCFDSNDANILVYTIVIAPPTDDGAGGSNTTSSTGVDPSSTNEMDDVFPANNLNGGANNTEPDYRDIDNADCAAATVWYAITEGDTTNDFHWISGSNIHSLGANTGSVRATTFCDRGGWYRFYNPLQSDKYILSVQNGTNTEPLENGIDYVEVKTVPTPVRNDDGSEGMVLMRRAWFIAAKGSLNGTVNVRFYYPQAEWDALQDSAQSLADDLGGTPDYIWYKTDVAVDYTSLPAQFDGLGNNYLNLVSSVSTENAVGGDTDAGGNSKNFVQFDGLTSFSGGTFGSESNTPLSVKIDQLTAAWTEGMALIEWTTSEEERNDYFEVERSLDAKSFETIGSVPRSGQNNSAHRYTFADRGVSPRNQLPVYYRIKAIDLDGNYQLSKIVLLQSNEFARSFLAYPNPANTSIDIEYPLAEGEKGKLFIVNQLGQTLQTIEVVGAADISKHSIDISDWPAGIYQASLILPNGKKSHLKFVKE